MPKSDRDRMKAILTLIDNAKRPEPWNLRSFQRDVRWITEWALESLDAIDRLEGENTRLRGAVLAGDIHQRVQALSGGTE